MQEIYDFRERFLRFVLARNIRERLAGLRLNINLCVCFAEAHCIGADPSALQFPHHELAKRRKNQDRQDPCQQERQKRRALRRNCRCKFNSGFFQPFHQGFVRPNARFVNAFTPCIVRRKERDQSLCIVACNLLYLARIHHLQELVVTDLPHLRFHERRENERIKQQHNNRYNNAVIHQRLLRRFVFLHVAHLFPPSRFLFCSCHLLYRLSI